MAFMGSVESARVAVEPVVVLFDRVLGVAASARIVVASSIVPVVASIATSSTLLVR